MTSEGGPGKGEAYPSSEGDSMLTEGDGKRDDGLLLRRLLPSACRDSRSDNDDNEAIHIERLLRLLLLPPPAATVPASEYWKGIWRNKEREKGLSLADACVSSRDKG